MTTSIRATTILALVLTTALVGCARRPAVMSMATPVPVGSPVTPTPPGPRSEPTGVVIEERRDEIIVAERPEPAAFSDNRNVKAIYFDFDRYAIRPNDAQVLEVDAAWLKTNDMLILIEGQCDERGTAEYNLALGDRRAQAAKNYLVALGISTSRISTVSYGKERPVCTEHTEDCWAANRRGHLIVKPRG
jgi:peptidoglycan-associated lipoprotein